MTVHNKAILYTSENVADHTKEASKDWSSSSMLPGGQNGLNFLMFIYNIGAWLMNSGMGLITRIVNELVGEGNPEAAEDRRYREEPAERVRYKFSSPLSG